MFGIFELATETFRVDVIPVHRWCEALPKNNTQLKTPLGVGDIGKLFLDLEGHGGSHQTQCAFILMWLTLARPSEVVEAEWAEFGLDAAIWRIPATRMKKCKEHEIPLPRQAVEWRRGMATLTGDRKHLFPHRDGDWIERQLGNTEPNAVRRTYNHADYIAYRATIRQAWADWLDKWNLDAKAS